MQNTTTHDTQNNRYKNAGNRPLKIRVRHGCAPVHGGTESDFPLCKTRESVNTRVAQGRVPEGPSKSRRRCENLVCTCPEITCPSLPLYPAHTFFSFRGSQKGMHGQVSAGLSLHAACNRDPDLRISPSFSGLRVAGTCSSPRGNPETGSVITCLSAIRDSRERAGSPVFPQRQV